MSVYDYGFKSDVVEHMDISPQKYFQFSARLHHYVCNCIHMQIVFKSVGFRTLTEKAYANLNV